MNTTLTKTLKLTLMCSLLAAGAMRTADAAYVVIDADPVYGSAFPGLGWRAIGALNIPTGCAVSAGLSSFFWNPFTVTIAGDTAPVDIPLVSALCAGVKLQDTTLYFYNAAAPTQMVEAISIGTYTPDTPPVASPNDLTQNLIDFSMNNAQVVGFHTTLSTPKRATDLLAGGGNNCFSLEFSSDTARLVSFAWDALAGACGSTPLNQSTNPATVSIGGLIPNPLYTPPPLLPVVATVPEPTSLALVLGALAGLALRRRSRR